MPPDPLVARWRDTTRPLNWRAWQGLSREEQARLRYSLMEDLQDCDVLGCAPWAWQHTHRELLELKMCSGKEELEEG